MAHAALVPRRESLPTHTITTME